MKKIKHAKEFANLFLEFYIYANSIKLYFMKLVKKGRKSHLHTSEQFVNAVKWLKFMGDIKSSDDLAKKLNRSAAIISYAMNGGKVSDALALRIEKRLLIKHGHTLEDFKKPYLNRQAEQININEFASLAATQLTVIEATQKEILMRLSEIGELLKSQSIKRKKG